MSLHQIAGERASLRSLWDPCGISSGKVCVQELGDAGLAGRRVLWMMWWMRVMRLIVLVAVAAQKASIGHQILVGILEVCDRDLALMEVDCRRCGRRLEGVLVLFDCGRWHPWVMMDRPFQLLGRCSILYGRGDYCWSVGSG